MSSIVTAVFKATIGLLVNKGRDKVAEKLKDGDVSDQKFRGLIVREIDAIKSKLDGLSRKDLLASISFFEEGIELLYKVFDKARSRSEYGAVTTQAACAEAFSLAEGLRNLQLTDLDESATRALSNAKKRFEDSRRKATEAFNNEALETADRILAMQYRVMATILETVDNPADAVDPCRVCIKELNSLSAVQSSFNVQLKRGIQAVRGLVGKEERKKIISSVCHVNRVIYDVTQTVGEDVHLWIWPAVDTGEDKVDPLRDERVTEVLRKQDLEHFCVTPYLLGQGGEEEHKLEKPRCIDTNSNGQFIVGDYVMFISYVKVIDSTGTLMNLYSLPLVYVDDVATDMNDNIYVLGRSEMPGAKRDAYAVYEFPKTTDLPDRKFPVRGHCNWRLTVTDRDKVLVLRRDGNGNFDDANVVDVYETDGQLIYTFGKDVLNSTRADDIAAAADGRIMVVLFRVSCVHIFSEDGHHLKKFKLQGCFFYPRLAFHRASEYVVVAGTEGKSLVHVEIYTKDGAFVRSTQIHQEQAGFLRGMTVTTEGRIAVVYDYWNRNEYLPKKILVM